MINEDTARRIAIKFFEKEGLIRLAERLERDEWFCCEDALKFVVKRLGKVRTRKLYETLPEKLKIYFLACLESPLADKRFRCRVRAIQESFGFPAGSPRPERLVCFRDCIKEMDNALQSYLGRR